MLRLAAISIDRLSNWFMLQDPHVPYTPVTAEQLRGFITHIKVNITEEPGHLEARRVAGEGEWRVEMDDAARRLLIGALLRATTYELKPGSEMTERARNYMRLRSALNTDLGQAP